MLDPAAASAWPEAPAALPAPWARRLALLAVKSHVALGGLGPADRALALGLAGQALAEGEVCTEAQVNARLRRALAGAVAFLGTDHVELRRWLVDSGLWTRDGFGRAYRRASGQTLPAALGAVQQALAQAGPTFCAADAVPALRRAHAAQRAQRRQAHAARAGAAHGADGG